MTSTLSQGFELTIIVPVFNECRTLTELLARIEGAPYRKQVLIVDDGSTDGSREILTALQGRSTFRLFLHEENQGKGCAIRTGIPHAEGEVTIIQDADLEYDPQDYPLLVETIRRGQADVVYGSRYLSGKNRLPFTRFRLGVHALNLMVWLLYWRHLSDEATCYKAFRTPVLKEIPLECRRFEFCPEVTAKVLRLGHQIIEVPIRYHYRTMQEGKKIRARDFFEAVRTLIKWRILPVRRVRWSEPA